MLRNHVISRNEQYLLVNWEDKGSLSIGAERFVKGMFSTCLGRPCSQHWRKTTDDPIIPRRYTPAIQFRLKTTSHFSSQSTKRYCSLHVRVHRRKNTDDPNTTIALRLPTSRVDPNLSCRAARAKHGIEDFSSVPNVFVCRVLSLRQANPPIRLFYSSSLPFSKLVRVQILQARIPYG